MKKDKLKIEKAFLDSMKYYGVFEEKRVSIADYALYLLGLPHGEEKGNLSIREQTKTQ